MDAVIRRCPFLTVVPSLFLQAAGRSSLLSYAHRCPVMMDLAPRPLARALSSSASASKGTPANDGQLEGEHYNACIYFLFSRLIRNVLPSCSVEHEVRFPPGHVTPPAGQAVGSKCPFLAAEMVQKNNRVVREASMELQEDVQEMHSVRTGKQSHSHTCNSIQ